jgi:regulatory protein
MSEKSPLDRVYARAVAMLAARGRSAKELRERLVEKGEDSALVDEAIAKLLSQRLLDDSAYAGAKARSSLSKGRSTRRAVIELERKGVDRDTAKEAIAGAMVERGEDELSVCERAARKKLRALTRATPDERRQKLYGFLARQGFSSESVRKVLSKVLTRAGEEAPIEDADALE